MNKNNFFKTSNRRAFALVLAAALVLAVLSGCSGSGQKVSSEDAIAKYGSDTMKLYILTYTPTHFKLIYFSISSICLQNSMAAGISVIARNAVS
ncbi:MAG: hypothetical protein IKC04_00820, partial [Oscillospiraceae bacterium]|nr:hypothetical protein [Oscillospiraceae bacterium]